MNDITCHSAEQIKRPVSAYEVQTEVECVLIRESNLVER